MTAIHDSSVGYAQSIFLLEQRKRLKFEENFRWAVWIVEAIKMDVLALFLPRLVLTQNTDTSFLINRTY